MERKAMQAGSELSGGLGRVSWLADDEEKGNGTKQKNCHAQNSVPEQARFPIEVDSFRLPSVEPVPGEICDQDHEDLPKWREEAKPNLLG
jgi:hypothetical protein